MYQVIKCSVKNKQTNKKHTHTHKNQNHCLSKLFISVDEYKRGLCNCQVECITFADGWIVFQGWSVH